MPASCSLIVVNYRSATLAIDAVRTARAATRGALQVVVVDNSVDGVEADLLRPHADVLIAAEANLGYGTAINRARRHCDGEIMIASNPDVRFGTGSIDALVESGADVAGPALFWDDAFAWVLPPSDLHTTAEAFDSAIASHWAFWKRRRDRRRIRRRLAFWSLQQPAPAAAISGAVMAIRRAAFDRVGGFDERFHLYFEEIDFLRRLRSEIAYVPAARCRHIYNQSAGTSPRSAAAYARSEELYLRKWSPAGFALAAKRLERPPRAASAIPLEGDGFDLDSADVLVEASPLASFQTAAGHFPTSRRVVIPPEVWRSFRHEALYLRVIDVHSCAVLATYVRARIV